MWLLGLFFPEFCKSDMSKYGYLEVFEGVHRNYESRLYIEFCFLKPELVGYIQPCKIPCCHRKSLYNREADCFVFYDFFFPMANCTDFICRWTCLRFIFIIETSPVAQLSFMSIVNTSDGGYIFCRFK